MIKKIILGSMLIGSIFAQTIDMGNGWNNVGLTEDASLGAFDMSGCVKLIWEYKNEGFGTPQWYVHVSDPNNFSVPVNYNLLGDLKAGDAIWVLVDNEIGCEVKTKPPKTKMQKMLYPGHTMGEFANWAAFAALREDGSVVTWGNGPTGGDSSEVVGKLYGIKKIYSNSQAFAALTRDGHVVTWGHYAYGGTSSYVSKKLHNIKAIYPSYTTSK